MTLLSGVIVSLGELVDPINSPLVSKFRTVLASHNDFAAHGDGKAWTVSADVCPAINAASAFLNARGAGPLCCLPARLDARAQHVPQ
ncbi:hypothetical protein R1A27_22265 [Methylobacterium sp. NMS12]|uniref:hypothetical protein n=1 Tax=Methylobacterium sp. NMS12 TaxID=3079766 RepID=UPI003F883E02